MTDPKEEIRRRIDVAELIGEYLELKRAGGASLKAVCPFHAEKTPSFYVSKEKQIWHCFGCDKGGDIYAFMMEMEGIAFPEALRLLAKKAGVEIPRFSTDKANTRSKLVEINVFAQKYFAKVYEDASAAEVARSYVSGRGIPEDMRQKFGLGFALPEWDKLSNLLKQRKYRDQDLVAAGVSLKRRSGSGVIDRFRNRIMIPIHDVHGNVIAFTGRQLPGDDDGPKYMNSPETDVYHKGRVLYGLYLAKKAIKTERAVIVVEGNLDVVASHMAGVEHVVASSGTALTEDQIQLLKRFTNTIIFCFDKDAAGFQAAHRGIRLATSMGCDVQVLLIPSEDGKDPDEVVQKSPDRWREIVATPIDIMQYYVDHVRNVHDLHAVKGKQAAGAFLLPEIALIQDPIVREHWLRIAADLLQTKIDVLRENLSANTPKPAQKRPAVMSSSDTKSAPEVKTPARLDRAFDVILAAFIQFPGLRQTIDTTIDERFIPQTLAGRLYETAVLHYHSDQYDEAPKSFFSAIADRIDDSLRPHLEKVALHGERLADEMPTNEVSSYLQEHINVFLQDAKSARRTLIQHKLRDAEQQNDQSAVQSLLEELGRLV